MESGDNVEPVSPGGKAKGGDVPEPTGGGTSPPDAKAQDRGVAEPDAEKATRFISRNGSATFFWFSEDKFLIPKLESNTYGSGKDRLVGRL